MTPGARLQAFEEILTLFFQSQNQPLETLLKTYFRDRRYAGAQDRRSITQEVFCFFRQGAALYDRGHQDSRLCLIDYLLEIKQWTLSTFEDHFTGAAHHPTPLTLEEHQYVADYLSQPPSLSTAATANVPTFLWPAFEESFGVKALEHARGLQQDASVDLRVNTLKTDRDIVLKKLQDLSIEALPTPHSSWGLRLERRSPIKTLELYQKGWIEIQDEGSQMITFLSQVKPGESVLDLCAGAGGKTLTLAAMMKNQGTLVATDVDLSRLERARRRLRRGGVINTELMTGLDLEQTKLTFDVVVIDVPCSGTGTWRRAPDHRARLTPDFYQFMLKTQQEILSKAASFLKPTGRLVYITCSVLKSENEDQVHRFLTSKPDLTLDRQLRLSPLTTHTDGFYGAVLQRTA